jgi:hypothetical protein
MPVTVVLDYPQQHTLRRVGRGVSALIGSLMILVGLAALPTTLLLNILVVMAVVPDNFGARLWGCPAATITVLGPVVGMRLIRGKRKLVLFLRRFGYSEATRTITFAIAKTTGRFWRLVTLDDAAIAPVGVVTSTRRFFRAGSFGGAAIGRVWRIVMTAALLALGGGIVGIVCLIGITLLGHEDPTTLFSHFTNPGEALSWDIPSAFYVLVLIVSVCPVVALFLGLLAVLRIPLLSFSVFFSMSSDAVRRAEEAKAGDIGSTQDIESVTYAVAEQSRKIFSPRLVVLKVDSSVWKQTVSSLASLASVSLIDVSEPTENVLWEIQELTGQFGSRCVFVGHYDRVRRLAAHAEQAPSPGALNDRLAILLDGQEVLAYTTDRHGMKRFARALRAKLQTLSGDMRPPQLLSNP